MFESIRRRFRERHTAERKSLKDRVKELEKTVERIENASFISVEVGKPEGMFDFSKWMGVSTVLRELVEKLGYELVYRDKVREFTCIRKKSSKK